MDYQKKYKNKKDNYLYNAKNNNICNTINNINQINNSKRVNMNSIRKPNTDNNKISQSNQNMPKKYARINDKPNINKI